MRMQQTVKSVARVLAYNALLPHRWHFTLYNLLTHKSVKLIEIILKINYYTSLVPLYIFKLQAWGVNKRYYISRILNVMKLSKNKTGGIGFRFLVTCNEVTRVNLLGHWLRDVIYGPVFQSKFIKEINLSIKLGLVEVSGFVITRNVHKKTTLRCHATHPLNNQNLL